MSYVEEQIRLAGRTCLMAIELRRAELNAYRNLPWYRKVVTPKP